MAGEKTWKHSKRAAWREVAGEAVILDTETAAYYSLSGAGLRMWELLGQGKPAKRIAAILSGEFDADETKIAKDCDALVAQLKAARLLESA